MTKPFKTHGCFYRDGQGRSGQYGDHRLSTWRSFATLRAALTGVRHDLAEVEADGLKPPLWTAIWFEHPHGQNEIVAVWKRGRFLWVDPLFRKAEA